MGAEQSEMLHSDAIYSSGYTSISETSSNKDLVDHDFQEKHQNLTKTAFHASWHVNTNAFRAPKPRKGIAYGFHSSSNKIFFAFGEKENNELSSELISYDVKTNRWSTVLQRIGQARTHATGNMYGDHFYIFGGKSDDSYFNDLYKINVYTSEIAKIHGDGIKPSPRCNAVIGHFEGCIIIWGGKCAEGKTDNDIHVYNIKNNTWSTVSSDVQSRIAPSFTQMDNKIYIYGSSEKEGMLILDMQTLTFEIIPKNGTAPQTTVEHPGLVAVYPNYILCFGGSSEYHYTHLFAFDTIRKWWFVFHIKPSQEDESKGEVNDLGLFKIPRQSSFASIYDSKTRQIISVFGNHLEENTPIGVFDLAKALALCNQREDLLSML